MNSSTQKKKHGYRYRRSWYLRAIVIDQIDGRTFGRGPYHNIRNVSWSIQRFMQAMKMQFPGATHVNFYNFKGEYQFQERYQVEQQVTKKKLQPISYFDHHHQVTGEQRYYNDIIFAQFDP